MAEIKRSIFVGMQILLDNHWVLGQAIVIEDQKIRAILPKEMIKHHLPAKQYVFHKNCYLIPGLIDMHIHGIHGCDVMDGTEEALRTMSGALAAEGVTGYLATTMTASNAKIEKVLGAIATATLSEEGAAILGIHLEGPFIAKAKMGAQSPDEIQVPNIALVESWQKLANNAIKVVTLAPELPGAIELITALKRMGIIVSVGHTNANYAQTLAAINAGCTQATHLFNAMSGLHHREPGAAGALLLAEAVSVELIVDGVHLHSALVELTWRMKGNDKVLLVTDAMRATCLGDGEYELGGQIVEVIAKKALLRDGTLAGSTLRMLQSVKNMVQFSKCTLAEAIRMASYNPAKALGVLSRKGSIEIGKDADLVVLNADLKVQMTMREGREIFGKKSH
jgi:N-acetylglucosamine-6-phosphate deacetylase